MESDKPAGEQQGTPAVPGLASSSDQAHIQAAPEVATPQQPGTPSSTAAAAASPGLLREDQIRNAVTFLSHPKVRESSKESKHAFLERKGLTAAEIEEACRRVPDAPVSSGATYTPSSTGTATGGYPPPSSTTALPPKPYQQQQHTAGAATTLPGPQYAGQPDALALVPPQPLAPVRQPVRWTQVVLGMSVLVAGAFSAYAVLWPRAAQLWDKWTAPAREEERRRQAEAAANAKLVSDALEAQAEELRSTVDSLKQLVAAVQSRPPPQPVAAAESPAAAAAVDALRNELRTVVSELKAIKATTTATAAAGGGLGAAMPANGVGMGNGASGKGGGNSQVEKDLRDIKALLSNVASSSAPQGSGTGHGTAASGGYGDNGAGSYSGYASYGTPQQGQGPSRSSTPPPGQRPLSRNGSMGKGVNGVTRWLDPLAVNTGYGGSSHVDRYPVAPASRVDVHRSTPSPTAAAAAEAAAVSDFAAARVASGSYGASGSNGPSKQQQQQQGAGIDFGPTPSSFPSPAAAGGSSSAAPSSSSAPAHGSPAAPSQDPPHPASYMEVLEMLKQGITPPGIRDDINDTPPNPLVSPSEGRLKPRPKPWERQGNAATPSVPPPSASNPYASSSSSSPAKPAVSSPARLPGGMQAPATAASASNAHAASNSSNAVGGGSGAEAEQQVAAAPTAAASGSGDLSASPFAVQEQQQRQPDRAQQQQQRGVSPSPSPSRVLQAAGSGSSRSLKEVGSSVRRGFAFGDLAEHGDGADSAAQVVMTSLAPPAADGSPDRSSSSAGGGGFAAGAGDGPMGRAWMSGAADTARGAQGANGISAVAASSPAVMEAGTGAASAAAFGQGIVRVSSPAGSTSSSSAWKPPALPLPTVSRPRSSGSSITSAT